MTARARSGRYQQGRASDAPASLALSPLAFLLQCKIKCGDTMRPPRAAAPKSGNIFFSVTRRRLSISLMSRAKSRIAARKRQCYFPLANVDFRLGHASVDQARVDQGKNKF